VLDSPERRAELVARGLERAAEFSWQRSVQDHAELYLRSV
jgi:hypothetical protein